jgi:hypothetical protein
LPMLRLNLTRSQRIAGAIVLAIVLSMVIAAAIDTNAVSSIRTGDFPAFYTLAAIADGSQSSRLYDQGLQRSIQSALWPGHLRDAFLPAAYPPYVAVIVRPLAWLGPTLGRIAWLMLSLATCLCATLLCCRLRPELAKCKIEVLAVSLIFAPLLLGVAGGQVVGFSAVTYLGILRCCQTERPWTKRTEFVLGLLVGAWFFKPQYALVALLPLVVKRRWSALGGACAVVLVYYGVGTTVLGFGWPASWFAFAQQFAEMNFISNSYQMTNLVAAVRQLQRLGWYGGSVGQSLAAVALVISVAMIAVWAISSARARIELFSVYLMLPPLLAVATPQANFYDLGLSVFPLLLVFPMFVRRSYFTLAVVWLLALLASLGSSADSLPWFTGLSLVIYLLISIQRTQCAATGSN